MEAIPFLLTFPTPSRNPSSCLKCLNQHKSGRINTGLWLTLDNNFSIFAPETVGSSHSHASRELSTNFCGHLEVLTSSIDHAFSSWIMLHCYPWRLCSQLLSAFRNKIRPHEFLNTTYPYKRSFQSTHSSVRNQSTVFIITCVCVRMCAWVRVSQSYYLTLKYRKRNDPWLNYIECVNSVTLN